MSEVGPAAHSRGGGGRARADLTGAFLSRGLATWDWGRRVGRFFAATAHSFRLSSKGSEVSAQPRPTPDRHSDCAFA